MKLIAESAKLNKTIDCKVLIDANGDIETEFPITLVEHPTTKKKVYCVVVPSYKLSQSWGIKINVPEATVPLQDGSEWEKIKEIALNTYYKNKEELRLKECQPFLEKAKSTGKRQLVSRVPADKRSVIAHSSHNGRYVYTYANPDGSITVE